MGGGRLAPAALLSWVSLLPVAAYGLVLDRELSTQRAGPSPASPAPSVPSPLRLKASTTLSAKGAAAAPAGRPFPGPTQPLIVSLTVNATAKDERFVRITPAGDFLLKLEDLKEIATVPQGPAVYEIEGESYVELRSLSSSSARFDEKTLTLEVTLPAASFPHQMFDLRARGGEADLPPTGRSALLNYRLGYARFAGSGSANLSLAAEAALTWGDWLLRNQSYHARSAGGSSSRRLETQAIRDDRGNLSRLVLGDAVTPSLALGSSVPIGGITLSKAYFTDPYFIRQPAVAFRGMTDFPSQVDFYVGNTLLLRQQVAPGPFDIRNFSYFGGQRDMRVVIRDAFGREQTIAYPFYFANQGLAAGLHDYSYQVGRLRRGLSGESNDYGRAAFAAFHQYGFSDSWTLGLRTEGTSRLANFGGSVLYRDELLGLSALHSAASRDRDTGRSGHALSMSHFFQRGDFSTQITLQTFSGDYVVLHEDIAPRLPRRDFSASLGYVSPTLGSINLAYTHVELHGERPVRSTALFYSKPLYGGANLIARYRRQHSEPAGHEWFVGLQYVPRPDQVVNLSADRSFQGNRTASFSWSNQIPRGEGLAYSLGAQRQESAEGTAHVVAPRLEWYSRWGVLSAEAARRESTFAEGSTAYVVALAGSLVAAKDRFALSRPIADSFAILEISPPLAGIRVYENHQEIGRTDARGRLLLPSIASFANNYASIQDKDVPIEYAIERVGRTFAPSYRSGTLVPITVTRIQAFVGSLRYGVGGESRSLEYHLVTIKAGGRIFEVPTGRNGDFYLENLPAGRHPATVEIRGRRCEFSFDVPTSSETQVSLGEVVTCNVAR